MIGKQWQLMYEMMLTNNNVPAEPIDLFIELTRQFVRDRAEEVARALTERKIM